jgi:hypothetical protein
VEEHPRAIGRERKVENARSLEKERPPLCQEHFHAREVEHRRVGVDLSEIRVEGRIDRDVRHRQPLEVTADRRRGFQPTADAGGATPGDDVPRAPQHVWRGLDAPWCADVPQPA